MGNFCETQCGFCKTIINNGNFCNFCQKIAKNGGTSNNTLFYNNVQTIRTIGEYYMLVDYNIYHFKHNYCSVAQMQDINPFEKSIDKFDLAMTVINNTVHIYISSKGKLEFYTKITKN